MRKNYLLLAASAMLLASCSNEADGPKNVDDNNAEDVITLTSLSPSSQASRITKVNGTRGVKSERLTLEYKIAPVSDAQQFNWSATSVVSGNGGVYVTWHSDAQATNPATKWGGALDVIAFNPGEAPSFSNTYVNYNCKFNMAIYGNDAFYIALTDNKMGAAVARVPRDQNVGIVRQLTGSSTNALSLEGDFIYAASGYKNGGVSKIGKNFPKKEDGKANVDTLAMLSGCKYIVDGLVLRTDAEHAYIYDINAEDDHEIGAPLLSATKYAEEWTWDKDENGNPTGNGNWTVASGEQSRLYGKHTMAVDGNYIYVAGGQAETGSDKGLRVIDKRTWKQVWGNASNTNAVCVADGYVYAATADGLRVYKTYDAEKNDLELFAFETLKDENGNFVMDENDNPKAGTDAHSCNFVAVDGDYVYMANGQSGVYVFKLDKNAPAQPEEVTPAE